MMKEKKVCSLTIEFSDNEYSMLSKAAAEHGYDSVEDFAEQVITQMYKGWENEADANHNA
jgi:hypothetical protein